MSTSRLRIFLLKKENDYLLSVVRQLLQNEIFQLSHDWLADSSSPNFLLDTVVVATNLFFPWNYFSVTFFCWNFWNSAKHVRRWHLMHAKQQGWSCLWTWYRNNKIWSCSKCLDDISAALRQFLQSLRQKFKTNLQVARVDLYLHWSAIDKNMRKMHLHIVKVVALHLICSWHLREWDIK